MGKRIPVFLFAIVFLFCITNIVKVKADTTKSMDTIILLDKSGSMVGTDRTRIALEAVKLYIDMIQTTGTRIGIITFNDEATKLIDLTQINDQSQKDYIKSEIDKIVYDGYTDIGMSLAVGMQEISQYIDTASNPLIILFTDGKIEMNEENPNGRTVDDSLNDVNSVLDYATGLIPIYTVGLNYNGTVDANLLDGISRKTGARSYITDSAASLPQIFNEIFADFIKSTLIDAGTYSTDGRSYIDVDINIPNPVVAEANIVLLSSSKILEISLTDPNGVKKEIPSDETVFTVSNKYSMLKIITPIEGVWTMSMKGSKDDIVKVNLIYNYNLDLIMDFDQPEEFGRISVTGKLSKDNKDLTDPLLYQDLLGTIVIESSDGEKYELRMENTGTGFTGSVSEAVVNSFVSDVDVYIKASGRDYNRESNKVHITVVTETPEPSAEPTSSTEPTVVPAAEPTATPTEQPTAEPTAAPTAKPAKDASDNGFSKLSILLILVVLLAILAIVTGALFFKRRAGNISFNGNIEVRIVDESGIYLPLEIANLSTFAGSAKISDVIMSCMDIEFIDNIDELLPILSNIVIKPHANENMPELVLENSSGSSIRETNGQIVKDKKFIWANDAGIVIKASDYGVKVELTYKADYLNV